MRTGPVLIETTLAGFDPLGAFNQPVYKSAQQLRTVVRNELGERFSNYFALPELDQDGHRISWVAPVEGYARRWSELTPEEQARLETIKSELNTGFFDYLAKLQNAPPNSSRFNFGKILEQALWVPSADYLFFVGDQPVAAFWGFQTNNVAQPVQPLMLQPLSRPITLDPNPAGGHVAAAPAPLPADEVVQERRRGGLGFFGWLLLLLLVLAALGAGWWFYGDRLGLPRLQQFVGLEGPKTATGLAPATATSPASAGAASDRPRGTGLLEGAPGPGLGDYVPGSDPLRPAPTAPTLATTGRIQLIPGRVPTGPTVLIPDLPRLPERVRLADGRSVYRDRIETQDGSTVYGRRIVLPDGRVVFRDQQGRDTLLDEALNDLGTVPTTVTATRALLQEALADGTLPPDALPDNFPPLAPGLGEGGLVPGEDVYPSGDPRAGTPEDPTPTSDPKAPDDDGARKAAVPEDRALQPSDPKAPVTLPKSAAIPQDLPALPPTTPEGASPPAERGQPIQLPPDLAKGLPPQGAPKGANAGAAAAATPADFMRGVWQSRSGLTDEQGRPLEQYFRFNEAGQGEVVLRKPNGSECRAAAEAVVAGGRLSIREGQLLRCSDGSAIAGAETRCERRADGQVACVGLNRDGSQFDVQMEQPAAP